jgi:ferric-dicitrate binding protein FerR (iron transport regulator)
MTNRDEEMKDDRTLEAAITRALERQPEVVVPEDFAARVRALLPAQPKVKARRSVGKIAGTAGAAALIVALCWLAPHTQPNFGSLAFDMEMLLLIELAGVAAWLAMRRHDV